MIEAEKKIALVESVNPKWEDLRVEKTLATHHR
jgi:hypothetical protein